MEGDKLGLVVYSSIGEVISGLTADLAAIMDAIDKLHPGGSTNACEGLDLGYAMMREGYEEGKINRIILCSDGVANVGVTDPNEILAQVRQDADKGITLTTLGFGMGNYNDILMEQLANHGDGCYYYIDSDEEAQRLFANGAVHLLMILASDAKVQVVFNSRTVEKYRLLGYENRGLEEEDFTDDSVDAGEVGAGQTVTALYEIRIWDAAQEGDPGAEVALVKIRYQDYETKEIEELYVPVLVSDMRRAFNAAGRSFRFTAAVAEFAEILRECEYAEDSDFKSVLEVAEPIAVGQKETEFVELVRIANQFGR
jgi:Ca-activated chloride channel family protein